MKNPDSPALCTLCRSEATDFAFQAPLEKYTAVMGRAEGVNYRFCRRCTILYQWPQPSENELNLFYSCLQRTDATGHATGRVPKSHLVKKTAINAFKRQQMRLMGLEECIPGPRVFEIGAAEGSLLATFRDCGFAARGIEPLDVYARYAREVLGLDVQTGFFGASNAHPESADLVILDNVLEHLPDPFATLSLIREMLPAGGILYAAVPCAETATAGEANVAHLTLWTRRALAFALESAGFSLLNIIRGRVAQRPHEWVCSAQARTRAKPITVQEPELYPAISPAELIDRWETRIRQFITMRRRRERFGKGYDWVTRAGRRLQRIGLLPRDTKWCERIT